jgi:hypothetical protein
MKRSGRWALSLALIGLLVVIGWRAVVNLQHKKQAANHAAVPQELPIQLAAQEVLTVQPLQLALSVPLNGVVQAVNSAVVKAYVAGELRGLTVREGDSVSKGQQLARRCHGGRGTLARPSSRPMIQSPAGDGRNQDNNAPGKKLYLHHGAADLAGQPGFGPRQSGRPRPPPMRPASPSPTPSSPAP